jgi:hypothetical protein
MPSGYIPRAIPAPLVSTYRALFGEGRDPDFRRLRALQLFMLTASDPLLLRYLELFDPRIALPAPEEIAFPSSTSIYRLVGSATGDLLGRAVANDAQGVRSAAIQVTSLETNTDTYFVVGSASPRYYRAPAGAALVPLLTTYQTGLEFRFGIGDAAPAQVILKTSFDAGTAGSTSESQWSVTYAAPVQKSPSALAAYLGAPPPIPANAPELLDLFLRGETPGRRTAAAALMVALGLKERADVV